MLHVVVKKKKTNNKIKINKRDRYQFKVNIVIDIVSTINGSFHWNTCLNLQNPYPVSLNVAKQITVGISLHCIFSLVICISQDSS